MEESNLDYFDDERGEVVLHKRDSQSRRPYVGSKKFDSFDDSFGYERRSNSFDASLDRISDRRPSPPHRRLNSFDESFDRVSSPQQYDRRRASMNDSFEKILGNSSYQRDSSFDRMRQRIEASRFDESFNSQNESLHDRADIASRRSSTSTGMEWSDYSKVKSKSKNLSTILNEIQRSRGVDAGREAIIPRRNTAAIGRSPSPQSRLHHRTLSAQSQRRKYHRGRSSSVGPGARGDGQPGMSSIMKALTTIKASSRRPSQSSLQASGDEHASKMCSENIPIGRIESSKSLQQLNTSSFPRVLSENSFTGPTSQNSQHRQLKPPYQTYDDNLEFSHISRPEEMQSEIEKQKVCRRKPPPPPPRRTVTSPQNIPRDQNFLQRDQSDPRDQHHSPMNEGLPVDKNDWRQYQQPLPQGITETNELQQPPHHDEDWRKYQQTSAQISDIDGDWRKYQVSSQHNPPHQLNLEAPAGPNVGRSQSAGREDPGGDNIDSPQHRHRGNPDWMTYQVGSSKNDQSDNNGSRSVSAGRNGRTKMFGRVPEKHINDERHAGKTVKKMPFTDQFGDFGLYTGQVNDESRPHGKGSMKYDNGGEVYVAMKI